MKTANWTGTCAFCGAVQKVVVNGKGVQVIARHGYRQLGRGAGTTRSCFGGGKQPAEVSPFAALEAFIAWKEGTRAVSRNRLANPTPDSSRPSVIEWDQRNIADCTEEIEWAKQRLSEIREWHAQPSYESRHHA